MSASKPKKKDSLVWLEELVEAAKAWRASLSPQDVIAAKNLDDAHGHNLHALATAVDGYKQAIKEEVEAEEEGKDG